MDFMKWWSKEGERLKRQVEGVDRVVVVGMIDRRSVRGASLTFYVATYGLAFMVMLMSFSVQLTGF